MAEGEPSYIDYEAFLDPHFSPASFANSLVLSTNNATDTQLDLSTPLSRVLFDLQEIDTHIHTLTTKSALPLLTHTQDQIGSAGRILKEAEEQIASVTQGYERLEREVLRKWEAAEEARVAAQKSLETVRLARAVARCLSLGRQLESQLAEISGRSDGAAVAAAAAASSSSANGPRDDFLRGLERAAYTIVSLRRMFTATAEGDEGYGLDRVKVIRTLRNDLVFPAENTVKARAQQAINRFSISALSSSTADGPGYQAQSSMSSGYKQARDARTRLVSAATTLYILSPVPKNLVSASGYQPELLLSTLQGYMYTAISSSLTALSRGLSMLPTLERTLLDVSAKCQDIVALEAILSMLKPPTHPLSSSSSTTPLNDSNGDPRAESSSQTTPTKSNNLLKPLLQSLDTPSLPSYFWRSLASSLTARVKEILDRGGVSARALRSNRDRLKTDIRDCVLRGSRLPTTTGLGGGGGKIRSGTGSDSGAAGNWEREAAVMVHSVVGALGR